MKKLVREKLNEEQKSSINFSEEITYYTDIVNMFGDDPEYQKEFEQAIKEFGISAKNAGVITSYNTDDEWNDIKNELDKQQIEYYEFDLHDGESAIIVSLLDFADEYPEDEDFDDE